MPEFVPRTVAVPPTRKAKPSVAVLLAAFNGVRWLAEQLDSIIGQENVQVTVFVSVDKSNDGTEEWFDLRAKSDDRLIILPYGERFGGAAPNFFRLFRDVDFSGFDYVCLADQDDIWQLDKLNRAHKLLLQRAADAYSSNVTAFWPSGKTRLISKAQPQREWDFLFEAAGPGCTYVFAYPAACAIQALIKAQWAKVQQVGLHDWFFYAFARTHGYLWVIDEAPTLLYRQHSHNQVGVNRGMRAFFHRARKIWSGWAFAQSILIASLVDVDRQPFVTRWSDGSKFGLLWLAIHARQCRRKGSDQIIFAVSCVGALFAKVRF